MTPKEISEGITQNALRGSSPEKLEEILNHANSYLLSDDHGVARQMQSAIQSIHAHNASLRAIDLEKKVSDLQNARKIDRWILLATVVGAVVSLIGICVSVYLSRLQ